MKRSFLAAAIVTWTSVWAQGDGGASDYRATRALGETQYDAKDFAGCASTFESAAERIHPGIPPLHELYSAASCAALAGDADRAFAALGRMVDLQQHSQVLEELVDDEDLASLHTDPRWAPLLASLKSLSAKNPLDPRLEKILKADQADRAGQIDASTQLRDRARRAEVKTLVDRGILKSERDLSAASLVFQHGESAQDYATAHSLAKKAMAKSPTSCRARNLVALTEDRFLVKSGKPQKYGTQSRCNAKFEECVLHPVDPAVTDAQRAALCVPPLDAQAIKRP